MGKKKNRCNILSINNYDEQSEVINVKMSIIYSILYNHNNNSGLLDRKRLEFEHSFIKMYGGEYEFSNYYVFASLRFISTYHKDVHHAFNLYGHDKLSRWSNFHRGKKEFIKPYEKNFIDGDSSISNMFKENFDYLDNNTILNSLSFSNSHNRDISYNNKTIKLYIPQDICLNINGSSFRKLRLKKIGILE